MFESSHPDFARQASDRSDGGLFLDLGAEVIVGSSGPAPTQRLAQSGMFESSHPDFARQASDRSDGGLFLDLGAEVHSWARRGRPRPIRGCYVFQ